MMEDKTNAMRLLEQVGIPYFAHSYPHGKEAVDGVSVANLLGQAPEQVFKTLVTKGASGGFCVFVIPVAATLDLKKAARAAGEKSVSMIPVSDINRVTGYVRGGCSPLGMKKQFPTFFDETAVLFDTICFSGGRIGAQIETNAEQVLPLCHGQFADLTME